MPGPAWLVLPTYNEAENIQPLIAAASDALAPAPEGYRILVVDDGSPDGTGRIADELASVHEEVSVLHRPAKGGLGRAYLAGFDAALNGGAGFVMEMDSDFSHDPADLPRLLAAVRKGADVALGSRYVAGGGVTEWNSTRRAVSRGGCWYARAVLGLRSATSRADSSAFGARCSRRSTCRRCARRATPSRSS